MIKDQKGFGLIEVVIVTVIVFILSFSLLKGCEIIKEARIKKFENVVLKWRSSAKYYYHIKGRLPGDTNSNFVIGDEDIPVPGTELIQKAGFLNMPPSNPMVIVNLKFWVYYGNDGNLKKAENVLVICAAAACNKTFTDKELKYMEHFDIFVDGEADGKAGDVKALSSITIKGTGNDRVVTHLNPEDEVEWASNNSVALVHFIKGRFK